MHRPLIFILCALILTACQLSNGIASRPTPTIDIAAVKTDSAATAIVQLTAEMAVHTAAAATAHKMVTEMAANITANPNVTPTPSHIPLTRTPTIEPTKVSSVLQPALVVQPADSFEGHTTQKITGWSYGFESFEWMGTNRLLLNAFVDEEGSHYGIIHPAVLNMDTKKVWLPQLTVETLTTNGSYYHYQSYWSSKLYRLISTNILSSGDMVIELYDIDGNLIKSYPGRLTSVSPSGTKIMVDSGTWLDLLTDKTVDFSWTLTPGDVMWMGDAMLRNITWSTDEMSVFTCCYFYGNARNGKSFRLIAPNYISDFAYGKWMLNDTYFIPDCCGGYQGSVFVGIFAILDRTLLNVNELADIPQSDNEWVNCPSWSALPDKEHVWLSCRDNNYLVDLKTFKSYIYPDSVDFSNYQWSPDGKFALDDSSQYILSVDTNDIKPISGDYSNNLCKWHPTDNRLLCISSDTRTLALRAKDCDKPTPEASCVSNNTQTILLLDAQTGSALRKLTFPTWVQELIWSPDGKRIALLAGDNSLWQVDYPGLGKLEQLSSAMPTPAATPSGMKPGASNVAWSPAGASPTGTGRVEPGVRNIVWSPDGKSLAFIGDKDIYIVDTQVKP